MKGAAKTTMTTLVIMLVGGFLLWSMSDNWQASREQVSVQQELTERAAVYNRRPERLLTEQLKFERVAVAERQLTFFYSLPTVDRNRIAQAELIDSLTEQMRTTVCQDPEFAFMRQHNVTIKFDYVDQNQRRIVQLSLPAGTSCN